MKNTKQNSQFVRRKSFFNVVELETQIVIEGIELNHRNCSNC